MQAVRLVATRHQLNLLSSVSGGGRPGCGGGWAVVQFAERFEGARCVGIDIEPPLPLPEDLLDVIATPGEREQLKGNLVSARLLFCMKEAVYKATHPIDGVFLEHHDVEVSLASSVALTSSGRCLRIYTMARPRLIALAFLTS